MKTNNAYSNGYCHVNYVNTGGPSGEKPRDWRKKENSSFTPQPLNNTGQRIIQAMQNKHEKISPTISFPQRVH